MIRILNQGWGTAQLCLFLLRLEIQVTLHLMMEIIWSYIDRLIYGKMLKGHMTRIMSTKNKQKTLI